MIFLKTAYHIIHNDAECVWVTLKINTYSG